MGEQVDLDAKQISNGVARWAAATSALNAKVTQALSSIQCRCTEATWGGDGAGKAFRGQFQPEQQLYPQLDPSADTSIVGQVSGLGPRVVEAVGLSLAADERQAAEMKKAVEG